MHIKITEDILFFLDFSASTKLYSEDWIGLKTLDEAGRVKFIEVAGNHLGISTYDMKKHIVPYLQDVASSKDISVTHRRFDGPVEAAALDGSSHEWPSPVKSFFEEFIDVKKDHY